MRVDLFSIGRFTVHSYGLMIAIGVIVAVALAMRRAKTVALSADEMLNVAIVVVVFGFAGAKVLFVLENWRVFLAHPLSVLGSSGFVVYGGILIGLFCLFVYCRWIRKIPFLRYLDLVFPSVALGQAFGRVGCFLAGCCYGKPTDAWWGVTFTNTPYAPNGVALIPTQLIMSVGDFVIFLVLFFFSRKGAKKVGDVSALYLILYGTGRFFVEFLRVNEQGGIGPFTTAQCFSLVFVPAGILLLVLNRRERYSKDYTEIFAEAAKAGQAENKAGEERNPEKAAEEDEKEAESADPEEKEPDS